MSQPPPKNRIKQHTKLLSPLRNTTKAQGVAALAKEQLEHFGIDPESDYGKTLATITEAIYSASQDLDRLCALTLDGIHDLPQGDRIARFNAKKFLSFQLAKMLDSVQTPFRSSYQALNYTDATQAAKGPYPIFDNVTALFSATPVIARTATYIYACAEWVEEAFCGRELMLEIYSRLLNPTSIALANYIVDIEAGPYAPEYLAWNYNSGMAAIDAMLSHVLGRDDVLIVSRNIYGGTHQLIHDWFAKAGNLEIVVETFDGYDGEAFSQCWEHVRTKYADRLANGRNAYVFLESPCNPHGYVLDVPEICKRAHAAGLRVMLDATVATPFLTQPLRRKDEAERPDFLMHSYTKDLSGTGSGLGGVVIGKNADMFIPKGESADGNSWDQTMFWNVYYVKGAFLTADASFEIMQGMRSLTGRMLQKCITTDILAHVLDAHPLINVRCNALAHDPNASLRQKQQFLGLPCPLFTINFEKVSMSSFKRFFDALSPTFAHMISLGQANTIISCPALTTHSELGPEQLRDAGLTPTTIRIATGDEDVMDLLTHFIEAARLTIDPEIPGFAERFMPREEMTTLIKERYMAAHEKYIDSRPYQAHPHVAN